MPEGADAYVMKSIVHDWDDEDTLRILRISARRSNRRHAAARGVRLPERPSAHVGLMFDVEMLVNLGGRERTRADFERLLSQAGFRVSRVIDTVSPLSIVEALPI